MAKEESSKSGGLLSKVVRFVRHPTVNWSDLDGLDGEQESQYSKQALKEMIERKRRNDFVRKREFDQLRRLRQAELQQASRPGTAPVRSEEHTSELQSQSNLVCRLLLEKKKKKQSTERGGASHQRQTHVRRMIQPRGPRTWPGSTSKYRRRMLQADTTFLL